MGTALTPKKDSKSSHKTEVQDSLKIGKSKLKLLFLHLHGFHRGLDFLAITFCLNSISDESREIEPLLPCEHAISLKW